MKSKLNKNIVNNEIIEQDSDTKGIEILNKHKKKNCEQRKKRIGKTLNEVVNEYESKKEKNETLRVRIKTIIISFIVIMLIFVVYLFLYYSPIFGIGFNKTLKLDTDKKIDIVSSQEDIYLEYGNEFLVYSNGVISTYNSNSKKTWEYKLADSFIPKIYIEGKYMLVSDSSSGKIYLFEGKQEILDKKLDGTISNVFLDNNGNMAIEYSTSGYKKVVGVYSKKGKNLYNAYVNSGNVIDIKIINGGNSLILFQTNSKSSKIGFSVNLINGKNEDGNMEELVKIDNNYLYDLTIKGKNIIMLLDDKIVTLNIETKILNEIRNFTSSQLMFVAINDNHYVTVEKALNSTENKYSFNTLRYDNSIIATMELENSPKMVKGGNLLNYFVYQDRLTVSNKWGILVKDIEVDFPPKDVVLFSNEKSAALIYTNKVYIFSL